MCTAVEETNTEAIINNTQLVVELTSEKEKITAVSQRSWVQIPYGPEFFSGLISTTSSVV